MTVATSEFDPLGLWQAQPTAPAPITLAEIHARALAFRHQALRRRMVSWAFMALAIAGLWFVRDFTGWMMQLGAAWTMVAVVFVLWRWQRVNSAGPLAGEGEALIEAYRSNLIRLRDARRSVLAGRIVPLIPGLVMVFLGRWFQLHAKGLPVPVDHWIILLTVAVVGLAFGFAYLRHQRQARELQLRLDELDRAREGA